jgi:hypothetical protein
MAATLRHSWSRLSLRIGEALPALMVFGPLAALASLLAATLADLRA